MKDIHTRIDQANASNDRIGAVVDEQGLRLEEAACKTTGVRAITAIPGASVNT
jgi:hypothetical protein